MLEGRTVLLATQRLSTLELADRAVVLRDGKIVEDGLPGELLVGDGDFAALFGDELIGVVAATGMTRLGCYLQGRWALVTVMILVATGSAAAQSGGWLLVRAGDRRRHRRARRAHADRSSSPSTSWSTRWAGCARWR